MLCVGVTMCYHSFTITVYVCVQVVYVWEMITPGGLKERGRLQLNLKHTLHGHTAAVTCLATSANYSIIVSGSEVRLQEVWLQR